MADQITITVLPDGTIPNLEAARQRILSSPQAMACWRNFYRLAGEIAAKANADKETNEPTDNQAVASDAH